MDRDILTIEAPFITAENVQSVSVVSSLMLTNDVEQLGVRQKKKESFVLNVKL